ncbi:type II secretion system protein GspL [Dokdonella sp.]|uniref:type II secretion system protein GspL n=1 Tax=Dokdonella sp. TaxID=2291710 RepID=UPI0031BE2BC1|nr:type II secretion system protein GspL [Dokdonella sp.]
MPDRLLLRLATDGGLSWLCQRDGQGAPSAAHRGVPPTQVVASAGSVWVLVPGEAVLLTSARVAARSRAHLLQALPFAIEDQLLAPVEELHFAASRSSDEETGVAAVARATLHGWLEQLAARGIEPDVLLPDTLALPLASECGTALLEDDRACVRLGPWSALACGLAELPAWLAHSADLPETLAIHDARTSAVPVPALPVTTQAERVPDALAFLAGALVQAPINLLEGDFAPRQRQARQVRGWRVAAMLAAAVMALAVVNLGVEVIRLARQSARLDTRAQDALRTAFPGLDASQLARLAPEQLMRGRIAGLRGGAAAGGLLHMLADIAPVLGTVSPTRIQTRSLEYRNGTLEVGLHAPDVAALDQVRERLAQVPGLKVEVTQANAGADGIDGRLRIRGDAP